MTTADARTLAERVADSMYERDTATQALGIRIAHVGPGYAELAMAVRSDMLNGHEICHGGFIFTLADSAFAYACNSYNLNTVASGCAIEFTAPASTTSRWPISAVRPSRCSAARATGSRAT
jgi:acyl-CoA thioesterase